MRAMVQSSYGPPEVIVPQQLPKPSPGNKDVLIRIQAAVVGPSDCAFRKGDPFIIKLIYGLSRPKFAVGGVEFAGVVEAVGVCDGGATALTFLRDKAKLRKGQKVLINGASGAVGIYAVQLAKFYGAEVTGVCSSGNVDLVRGAGADFVVDYTQEDFTKADKTYDVIFDAVGKSSFSACKRVLTPKGMYLTTAPKLSIVVQMLWTSLFRGKKAIFATAGLMQNKANLAFLMELVGNGTLRAVIDRRYPLEDLADAHKYVETGRKKGNVVITF